MRIELRYLKCNYYNLNRAITGLHSTLMSNMEYSSVLLGCILCLSYSFRTYIHTYVHMYTLFLLSPIAKLFWIVWKRLFLLLLGFY